MQVAGQARPAGGWKELWWSRLLLPDWLADYPLPLGRDEFV